MNNYSVTLEDARARIEAGTAILIDVREPSEHAYGVVAGARLLPTSEFNQRYTEIPTDPATPVYLICATSGRSSMVWNALRNAGGYDHVYFVEGGMSEWARRGWPMITVRG